MTPRLTAGARLAGVVGRPIAHSLSPLIHNCWLEAAAVDAVYLAFSPEPDAFARFVNGFRGGLAAGFNVTAPYKLAALEIADRANPRARAAGAANLLIYEPDGSLVADNLDGEGFLEALRAQAPRLKLAGARALVLGAGGAARGAVAALCEAGAGEVRILNRSPERAHALAREFACARAAATPDAAAGVDLVVNTLSDPGAAADRLGDLAPPAGAVAMDMGYRPVRTPFLVAAERRGLVPVDGLAMLIGQARPSFLRLFGRPAPEVDVRALAEAAALEEP